MSQNKNLHTAKKQKKDEFYTQLTDIEKECYHYREHFRNKVIYCNCDDARESNFFKYFAMNFKFFGLKKLITTGYKADGKGVCLVYEGDKNGNRIADDCEIQVSELQGNGDFRSEECIELLKQADIVVTNPPFSLFREYVAQLMEFDKKFLILGNSNAITFKEFFPLIKNGKVWLGRTLFTGKMPFFRVPNTYDFTNDRYEKIGNEYYKQVNGIAWFTNLPNDTNKNELVAYKQYSIDDYPKYDNYNAIECSRMENFPIDYDGVIGIPITGLKYLWSDGTLHISINGISSQFEIIDGRDVALFDKQKNKSTMLVKDADSAICGKPTYARILIKKK